LYAAQDVQICSEELLREVEDGGAAEAHSGRGTEDRLHLAGRQLRAIDKKLRKSR
jgi:hypothetical protein